MGPHFLRSSCETNQRGRPKRMLCQDERRLLAENSKNFFLHGLAQPEVETLIDEILLETGKQNRRACIVTARLVVWLVVLMSFYRDHSIVTVFEQLASWMTNFSRSSFRIVSEEAIYHARKRLGVAPLKQLFRSLRPDRSKLPSSFHGLRVFGIDGTHFDIPDTPQNSAVFKRHTSQNRPASFPQVQGLLLSELSTHRTIDALFTPCTSAEILGVPFLLKNLGDGDLLLMDSGLASFKNMKLCSQRNVNFVFRFRSNWKPSIRKVLADGDYIADFKPTAKAKEELGSQPLTLRVLEFRVGRNKKVRLVTDLIDFETFSAIEIARLYHRRWECELIYKELKSQLLVTGRTKTPTHFRSKSPNGILQECWGTLIAHLLARELTVDSATTSTRNLLTISFTGALSAIRIWLPRFQLRKNLVKRFRRSLLVDISRCLIDRPRRPRRFPRVVKSHSGRKARKNETHKETPLDLTIEFLPKAS